MKCQGELLSCTYISEWLNRYISIQPSSLSSYREDKGTMPTFIHSDEDSLVSNISLFCNSACDMYRNSHQWCLEQSVNVNIDWWCNCQNDSINSRENTRSNTWWSMEHCWVRFLVSCLSIVLILFNVGLVASSRSDPLGWWHRFVNTREIKGSIESSHRTGIVLVA